MALKGDNDPNFWPCKTSLRIISGNFFTFRINQLSQKENSGVQSCTLAGGKAQASPSFTHTVGIHPSMSYTHSVFRGAETSHL